MNNKYLKRIAKNTGSDTVGSKHNNAYLREIALNTGAELSDNVKSDNYYLKQIANNTSDDTDVVQQLQASISEKNNTISELQSEITTKNSTIAQLQQDVQTAQNSANNKIIFGNVNTTIQKDDVVELSAVVIKDGKLAKNIEVNFYKEE